MAFISASEAASVEVLDLKTQQTTFSTGERPFDIAIDSGLGATYVSNITLPGGKTEQVRFADAASQSAAEQLLRELAQAKGVAS